MKSQELLAEAQKVWTQRETYNPRQARFGNKNARKKFKKSPPVRTACVANDDLADDGSNASLDDMADAETAAAETAAAADVEGTDAEDNEEEADVDPYANVKAFLAPIGYSIINKPITYGPTLLKKYKVAHKFLTKWHIGTFKSKCGSKESPNYQKHAVYYQHDGIQYYHDLNLTDYGVDKFWVLLKRK